MLSSDLLANNTRSSYENTLIQLWRLMKGFPICRVSPYDAMLLDTARIVLKQNIDTSEFETGPHGDTLTPFGQSLTRQLKQIAVFINDGERCGWYTKEDDGDEPDHDEFAMPHLSILVRKLTDEYQERHTDFLTRY